MQTNVYNHVSPITRGKVVFIVISACHIFFKEKKVIKIISCSPGSD